jgi:hypothetical protein
MPHNSSQATSASKKTNPVSNNTTDLQTGAYKDSLKREKNILDDEEHQELSINFDLKSK